ncbi:MAG: hypothetical protein ACK5SD_00595 [Pseudanabaena sp.]
MKIRSQKLVFLVFTFGFIYAFSPISFSINQNEISISEKVLSQTYFKDYKAQGKFSIKYPQSWTIVEDIDKKDGTKTILFSKSGASKDLLGTVSMRVTLSNIYYRTSVYMGRDPSFENRQSVFINSPNSSGLILKKKGHINRHRYIQIEGDQDQGYYIQKSSNYFIEYSEKFDLVIETAIVNQVSIGNRQTLILDKDSYLKSVKEVNTVVSSLKIP